MRSRPAIRLRKLVWHTAMGAGLGAALALSLAWSGSRGIAAMIAHSATPANTFAVFVGAFAIMCAVGATLTGLIFLMIEEGER